MCIINCLISVCIDSPSHRVDNLSTYLGKLLKEILLAKYAPSPNKLKTFHPSPPRQTTKNHGEATAPKTFPNFISSNKIL